MLWRWIKGGLTVEGLNSLAGFLGLGNPIGWVVTLCLSAGAIAVGWFVAARAWAEGVLGPYGTLGYVVAILAIAILVLFVIGGSAVCYERLWMARSARRMAIEPSHARMADTVSGDDELTPEYNQLLGFFIDHLEPFAAAQWSLQDAILSAGVENPKIRALASKSISDEPFYKSVSLVASRLSASPTERVRWNELIVSIHNAEFTYPQCIHDIDELACSLSIDIKSDERLFPLWDDWRVKHNGLVRDYDSIKRNPRFGILFRPLRESKWGGPIPPAQSRRTDGGAVQGLGED